MQQPRENIKSLPATTLNRGIIQSVSRGFGHSARVPSFSPSPSRLLRFLIPPSRRGSFCFRPFANELSIKFYHATEINGNRRVSLIYTADLPSRFFPSRVIPQATRGLRTPLQPRNNNSAIRPAIQSRRTCPARFAFTGGERSTRSESVRSSEDELCFVFIASPDFYSHRG